MINSVLDNDFYSFTVGQLAFLKYSHLQAKYKLIVRSEVEWPEGFWDEVQGAIFDCNYLSFKKYEIDFLAEQKLFCPAYLDWLSKSQLLDSTMVEISDDGEVTVTGPWFKTIYWEIPLLAIISELYQRLTPLTADMPSPTEKVAAFDELGVPWADFGTRRRYSRCYQKQIVNEASRIAKNFLGTSNAYFAMKYGVKPIGTMSHQGPQAMQQVYGIQGANSGWMYDWERLYGPNLNIFLPDTLTTDYCIRRDGNLLVGWNGTRQDSGENPVDFLEKMLKLYKDYGIDARGKKIIFSDGLTPDKIKTIHEAVNSRMQDSYGIGTNLTNDSLCKPLNMVVKLVEINEKPVIKLSDSPGKYTGDPVAIEEAKRIIGI